MHQVWEEEDFIWSLIQVNLTSWLRNVKAREDLKEISEKSLTLESHATQELRIEV